MKTLESFHHDRCFIYSPIFKPLKENDMGKVFATIDDRWQTWIAQQKMFFVSTAPKSTDGLINCSPKGLDSFRVIDELTVAYMDLAGSGIETVAHLKENGRITIMFCAFDGPPKILRLYGKGQVLEKGTAAFEALAHQFPHYEGARSIIKVKVSRIQDACGFSVPTYQYEGERDTLLKWAEKKGGAEGVKEYINVRNKESLDGLPGINLE